MFLYFLTLLIYFLGELSILLFNTNLMNNTSQQFVWSVLMDIILLDDEFPQFLLEYSMPIISEDAENWAKWLSLKINQASCCKKEKQMLLIKTVIYFANEGKIKDIRGIKSKDASPKIGIKQENSYWKNEEASRWKAQIHPWKRNWYILTPTEVFLNQKTINVCSHTFILVWFGKNSVSAKTHQLSFCVYICAFHPGTSSFLQ